MSEEKTPLSTATELPPWYHHDNHSVRFDPDGSGNLDTTCPVDQIKGELADEHEKYTACKYNYDPSSTFGNLLHWHGTVLPSLAMRPTFWAALSVFTGTSICKRGFDQSCGRHLPALEPIDMTHAVSLLTFFLAFYTSTCHQRFNEQYSGIKAIEGHMRSCAIKVRNLFKAEEEIAQLDMMELFRFLCASYFLLFVRLYDGSLHKFNLSSAVDRGLVTLEEEAILKNHSESMQCMKMISWAFGHLYRVAEREEMEPLDLGSTAKDILLMRGQMNQVTYKYQMPIPLGYYHVITVLTITVTVLFSYAMAYSTAIAPELCWLVWSIVVFGLLGMREVAIQLAEPFGDDDCDLPVDNYVYNLLQFLCIFVSENEQPGETGQTFKDNVYWMHQHMKNLPDSTTRKRLSDILYRGYQANGIENRVKTLASGIE